MTNLEQCASGWDGSQITKVVDLTLLLEPGRKRELAGGVEAKSVGEAGRILLDPVLPRLCPIRDADLVARKERDLTLLRTRKTLH